MADLLASRQLRRWLPWGLIVLAAVLLQIGRAERLNAELVEAQAERLSLAHEWYQNIAVNSQRALAIGLTGDAALEQVFGEKM